MTNTLLSLTRTALYTLAAGLSLLLLFIGWAEVVACPHEGTAGIMTLFALLAVIAACGLSHLGMVAESALWRREHEAAMSLLYKQSSPSL